MTAPTFDPYEARAHSAARAALHAVEGLPMTGLAAPQAPTRFHAPVRTALVVTAAIAALLLIGAALAVSLPTRDEGVPAFEPRPMPQTQAFESQLSSHVGYRIPAEHSVTADVPDLTVLRFDGIATGAMIAMRVRSYPGADQRDLAAALRADSRVHIVRSQPSTVAGQPATRLVVRPVAGITASEWFCPYGTHPCFDLSPTGRTTLYLFRHGGSRYLLAGGAVNDSGADQLRPIVDGVAATWHW